MGMINSLTSSLAGMKTAQAQLDLISRNVSNVDTEGYSRKVANQKNVIIGGFSQGVSLGTVTRQVDQGLLKSYLVSSAASSSLSAQSEYVSKAETLLGSPQDNNSVAANVASLQAAFEKFATDVSSSSSRYELISQAETITNRLNYISKELQKHKAALQDAADENAVFLAICGGYQLLGHYYQPHNAEKLLGIGLLDAYTEAGNKRFIGNVTATCDYVTPNTLVGFENHSGLTYLQGDTEPMAHIVIGNGNNAKDKTEGARYKNIFGTYLHGSFLPKNPHFADYLITLALHKRYKEEFELSPLNDDFEKSAHKSLLNKKY